MFGAFYFAQPYFGQGFGETAAAPAANVFLPIHRAGRGAGW